MENQKHPVPDSNQKEIEHLHIFVNRVKFDETQGVTPLMSVDQLAALVEVPPDLAVVRKIHGNSDNVSEPLAGVIEVKNGDQFAVTRRQVNGGYQADRVASELRVLEAGGQITEQVAHPIDAVIYRDLPVLGNPTYGKTDVLVIIPGAYPAAMPDYVAVPVGSPLIGKVKGAPQGVFHCNGRSWQTISYHPHGNGGFGPWDPRSHGFHTYLGAILSWLGDLQ